METVWVVDDDRSIRWVLEKAFNGAQMEVRSFAHWNVSNRMSSSRTFACRVWMASNC